MQVIILEETYNALIDYGGPLSHRNVVPLEHGHYLIDLPLPLLERLWLHSKPNECVSDTILRLTRSLTLP
jgi:hypothetical protein